jgi:protein O-GlcNAc transferase
MASMLGSHPKTHLIPYETRWFLSGESSYEKAIQYSHNSPYDIIIEKTPTHVRKIETVAQYFPDAKFIIMIRHPYDVIASQYKRHGDLKKAITRVKKDYASITNVQHMECVKIVRYEDVVEKAEEVLKDVCMFVGLLFDAEMLNFHQEKRMFINIDAAPSDGVGEEEHLRRRAWQIQQPIFDGRGRWRGELSKRQIDEVTKSAGFVADELGYT